MKFEEIKSAAMNSDAKMPRPEKTGLRRAALTALIVCALWLSGCVSDPATVEDRSWNDTPAPRRAAETPTPRNNPAPGGSYRVVKGDTLYSIAFKRGLDYRDVAAWNGISAPAYKILVGQEVRFSPPGAPVAARPSAQTVASTPAHADPGPAAAKPTPAAAPSSGSMFEDVSSEPAAAPASAPIAAAVPVPSVPAPVPAPAAVVAPPSAPPTAPAPAAKPVVEEAPPPAKPVNDTATTNINGIAWRWPNGGKVISGFVGGDQTKQGVDIAGNAGDPVQAAADGEVVYSGNGLLGYGELIIVKHNASFLSAYGHNRKRLVAEGDKVKAGQQIAEMGSSASSRDELHFEIRKNGKPVNPLDYLPSR